MIISFYLSSLPVIEYPEGVRFNDKIIHIFCFAGLAGAWTFWFSKKIWQTHTVRLLLICIAITSGYGAFDEWHQSFTPLREVSFFDWLADFAGAIIGSVAGAVLQRVLDRFYFYP